MKLRVTPSLLLTIGLASVVLVTVAARAGRLAWTEFSERPSIVALPRGSCEAETDLAAVEGTRLVLSGEVDARAIDQVRDAAKAVWWTSETDDRLVETDCGRCAREAAALAAEFAPVFETGQPVLALIAGAPQKEPSGLGDFMKACPRARIDIVGYADSRWALSKDPEGLQVRFGVPYNLGLSQTRADAVRALFGEVVDKRRILSATGAGFTTTFQPSGFEGRTPEALRLNRTARVAFSFAPVPVVSQLVAAPAWSQSMFWEYWLLASAAGTALGIALALCVSWVIRLVDVEPANDENRLGIIEGIGPHFAERIEVVVGIRTIAQLASASELQLDAIAALRSDQAFPPVGRATADNWAAMAKLIQLPMVTKDWAELLVAAGVTTPDSLAARSPALLRASLATANVIATKTGPRRLAPWLPSVIELDYIIRIARDEALARRLRQRAQRRIGVARLARLAIKLVSRMQGRPVGASA